jgi:thioredoxin 1
MKQLIYFTAPWCGPCRQLGPIMQAVSPQVSVQKVDVDSNPDLAQKYGIRKIPTVVLTSEGVEVTRKVGLNPKQIYLNMYNEN